MAINYTYVADCKHKADVATGTSNTRRRTAYPTTATTIPQLDGANQESSEEEESEDSEEEDELINQVAMYCIQQNFDKFDTSDATMCNFLYHNIMIQ